MKTRKTNAEQTTDCSCGFLVKLKLRKQSDPNELHELRKKKEKKNA